MSELGPLPEPFMPAHELRLALGGDIYTAAQMQAERERCYALGVAAGRAEGVAVLDSYAEENQRLFDRLEVAERELAALRAG